jgi:hypothetical protein
MLHPDAIILRAHRLPDVLQGADHSRIVYLYRILPHLVVCPCLQKWAPGRWFDPEGEERREELRLIWWRIRVVLTVVIGKIVLTTCSRGVVRSGLCYCALSSFDLSFLAGLFVNRFDALSPSLGPVGRTPKSVREGDYERGARQKRLRDGFDMRHSHEAKGFRHGG